MGVSNYRSRPCLSYSPRNWGVRLSLIQRVNRFRGRSNEAWQAMSLMPHYSAFRLYLPERAAAHEEGGSRPLFTHTIAYPTISFH